ncbi:DUF4113 domain-containing protein [Stutzerimonas kunmingensis]|nr:DUF4113 domain-containing protein [Stutzerimonas kunmingensis]
MWAMRREVLSPRYPTRWDETIGARSCFPPADALQCYANYRGSGSV